MRVLEFDSVLLDDVPGIRAAVGIAAAAARQGPLVLVSPALKGVPEELRAAAREAAAGGDGYPARLQAVRDRHLRLIQALFPPRDQARAITALQLAFNDLEDVLRGVQLVHECTPRTEDLVQSFGVLMGCGLIAACLGGAGLEAELVDAREIVRTRVAAGAVRVEAGESAERIRRRLGSPEGAAGGATKTLLAVPQTEPRPAVRIVTAGVAATAEGVTTALGGDEYTAFLLGGALGAEEIEIWTDVDGVMSADPGLVPAAFRVEELNYQEAMEMSYFGARTLNPQAMIPAVERRIPIRIRDGRRPERPGTRILQSAGRNAHPIRGIASIDRVALVNIEGGGMIGIPGIAARVFGALARAGVNIMMISQASSEHSICLVFRENEAQRVKRALEEELQAELEAGSIEPPEVLSDLAIVAIIGENMRGTPGISGKLFSALGEAGVNVLVIAQGSSERNISLLVEKKDEGRALQAIHRRFLEGGLDG